MAIKKFEFVYGYHEATVSFEVDTEKFTADIATATLKFFTWDYDKDADPVDEVLQKYAIRAIEFATFNNHNEFGVIKDFANAEGFADVDGSQGIKLIEVSGYEFEQSELSLEVINLP